MQGTPYGSDKMNAYLASVPIQLDHTIRRVVHVPATFSAALGTYISGEGADGTAMSLPEPQSRVTTYPSVELGGEGVTNIEGKALGDFAKYELQSEVEKMQERIKGLSVARSGALATANDESLSDDLRQSYRDSYLPRKEKQYQEALRDLGLIEAAMAKKS